MHPELHDGLDEAWRPFLTDPGRDALLVDFDGSLAPIVDDPDRAVPIPEAAQALRELSGRLGLVAVVSGRPVAFLRRHLPDPEIVVVGQHGLEREAGGVVTIEPAAAAFEAAVVAAAADAQQRWPRLTVERKGRVAVVVHWRTRPGDAPDPAALVALAGDHGLAHFPGRMSCELRPPVPVDKGTAVEALLDDTACTVAAFAGDDHGDLAAFRSLAAWADAVPGRARSALRIAVASEESPVALLDDAGLVLDGPVALAAQLRALAATLPH